MSRRVAFGSRLTTVPLVSATRPPALSARTELDGERQLIERALAESKGKISGRLGAAASLGMPASTLESKSILED